MPTTVGSHAVATFTSPVNGTSPIDANQVRGNDNTLRTSYVSHDADAGIHVQSSTLSARPVAGVAGRKWITADTGSYKLWYDDGTTWHEVSNSGVDVFVVAGENLVKGDVVKVTGYNLGVGAPNVAKVASATDVAFGIVSSASIANGATGYITNTGLVQDVNTAAYNIGDILYPNASGGFTATKPTSGTYQMAAYVLRANANNGVLYVEFSGPRIVERSDNTASTVVLRDASGNFAAGTITAALTGNASTATALQNTRTLWGQNFNGTANVTGNLSSVGDIAMTGALSGATSVSATNVAGTLTTAAQPNVTSLGTLTGLTVSGTVTATTLGGTLSTAAQPNVTSLGTLTNVTVSGVASLAAGTASAPSLTFTGDTNTGVFSPGADIIAASTGGTERWRVDSNGNVGIGVTPSVPLHVKAANNEILRLQSSDTTTGGIYFSFYDSADAEKAYIGYGSGSNDDFLLVNRENAAVAFFTNATERVRIDASGNLGVGTTSMLGRFTVAGGYSYVTDDGTRRLVMGPDGTGVLLGTSTNHYLRFLTNDAERARITSGGYFKASNAGTYVSSTGAYHEFYQTASDIGTSFFASNASYAGTLVFGNTTRAANTAFDLVGMYAAGVGQFRVRGDGTLFAQNTTVQSISDARLKENVQDYVGGWDIIHGVRVVSFDWKPGFGNNRTGEVGVIAQELEAIKPSAVSEWEMDTPTGEVDEDGKPITEKVAYKTAGLGALMPDVIVSIQQAFARIESNEADIGVLRSSVQEAMARIETLEAKVAQLEAV